MNSNEMVKHISTIIDINAVEQIHSEEMEKMEHPRKGVLWACLARIGELHMDGQCLSNTSQKVEEPNPEVPERVEQPGFGRFLELVNFQHEIPATYMAATHFTHARNEQGDLSFTIQVEKSFYLKHREGCKRYMADILKAAQKRGMWARLLRNPVGEAYLRVNWGKQYQK